MKKFLLGLVAFLAFGVALSVAQGPPTPGSLVTAGFSQQVTDNPTVTAGVYASGNCVGGFRAVTVVGYPGATGFVLNFRVVSISAQIPTLTVYLFDSQPTTSTCTDRSTFTVSAVDSDRLISAPTAITLSTPTGVTFTAAEATFSPPRPFIAGGSTASTSNRLIWYGLVSGSVMTPAGATDIHTRTGVLVN